MKHYYHRKRVFLLSLLAMIAVNVVTAAPRSVQQAQQEARQLMGKQAARFARGQQSGAVADPQLVFAKMKADATDEAYYYVFSAGQNHGFTLVSGDDRMPAIIGYTESGNYDADNLPENFVGFMQSYQDYVDHATDAELEKIRLWKAMADVHEDVTPFVKAKWNQGAPYNNMCPKLDGNNRAVTGCVATAIAQVLHYYKYPVSLQADIPAYTTWTNHISMPGVSAGEIYDWDNMPDVYTGNETQAQNDAVAKLMLHVGCAMKMDYDYSSGAQTPVEPLIECFGMDKELTRAVWRRNYDIAEWDDMLYRELAEGRPVLYGGQSTGSGHEFVVHGYSDGFYAVNWGWGGASDGYFDITILNPYNTSGFGSSSTEDGYSRDNDMIIGLQPDNGIVDELDIPLFASYDNLALISTTISGNTLSGTVHIAPGNVGLKEGEAYFSVGYKTDNGGFTNIASGFEVAAESLPVGYWYPNFEMPFSFEFEENKTYRLCLIESVDNTNWTACEGAGSTSLFVQVQNGTVVAHIGESVLSATMELDEHSGGYAGMSNKINVTVTNTGDKEYYNVVYVFTSDTETLSNNCVYTTGITAPVDGSTTFDFSYAPSSEGAAYFWVLDASMNVIGKSSMEFLTADAPVLSLVSVTCSNASDEKTIGAFQGEYVDMDKVYGTVAEFTFEIKNDGGYYEGPFVLYQYHSSTGIWNGHIQMLAISGNTTTKFTFTAEGNIGDVVGVWLTSYDDNVSLAGLPDDKANIHFIYNNGVSTNYYYSLRDSEIAYLADPTATSVERIKTASLSMAGGKGVIELNANADTEVRIVNVGGVHVADVKLHAGEQTTVNVPAGIYIVNQTKIVVK